MSTNRQITNFLACTLLVALAVVPVSLPSTQSAYGDSESSVGNLFQASNDFTPRVAEPEVEIDTFALTVEPPGEVLAEIVEKPEEAALAETTPEVEVSEEPVELLEPKPVEVETGGEPLEVIDPTAQ